ncbi:MAG: ABC transporter permease [Pigmentiphaga sp.]|uniref:ABC transporter permease n=1 Tax=Pigmentiphaga sp. TaxID=1977564 RepID=UPI0029AE5228|nr:ABC transporter permease [Pigmentiphaga sp.]MDX3906000.1 ABC transporter permease [Pigmentiphaga sp.]
MISYARRLADRYGPPVLILALAIGAWEAIVRWLDLAPWLLPAPSAIAMRFTRTQDLWYHTGLTLLEAGAGFAISAVLGVALAAGIANSRFLERGILPYVIVSNAVPIIAIVPLLNIWLGFGVVTKIVIAAIITFFPIVTNATRGLKAADPRIVDLMHSINATTAQMFFKVQLPSALPFIFAGFKIAASLSLVGAVVGEFYGADRGLGYLVITAATQLRTDLLFVAIIVLAAIGITTFSLFGWLERQALRGETPRER